MYQLFKRLFRSTLILKSNSLSYVLFAFAQNTLIFSSLSCREVCQGVLQVILKTGKYIWLLSPGLWRWDLTIVFPLQLQLCFPEFWQEFKKSLKNRQISLFKNCIFIHNWLTGAEPGNTVVQLWIKDAVLFL